MVDKYVKPSISGFNSSPPPDDDSETAANAISWAGIKNKLADPIKTLLDSVNTGVDTLADSLFGNAVRADSSGGTITTSDYGKLIKTTNAVTITLLTGGDAGGNFVFAFYNADSTNNLTIARNGNNINGAASNLTISPSEGGIAFCDGTDWWVIRAIYNSTANTFTFNKEIVLGASSEVSTANSLQNVTNTLYHLATGTSWIFKAQGTGAVNDRLKIYADGVVGCDGSGNEVTGGKKGEGTANFIQVWDNGKRAHSATAEYNSGNQTITSAGALTLAHGLPAEPTRVTCWLKCLTGEHGFSVGDKALAPLTSSDAATDTQGFSLVADATNLTIRFGTNAAVFTYKNKTTGAGVALTNANWALVVIAQ